LLLTLASTVVLGSESYGTHDHILLSDGSGSLNYFGFQPSRHVCSFEYYRFRVINRVLIPGVDDVPQKEYTPFSIQQTR
jgi:hypothetical protein